MTRLQVTKAKKIHDFLKLFFLLPSSFFLLPFFGVFFDILYKLKVKSRAKLKVYIDLFPLPVCDGTANMTESMKGHMVDALALGGDEGRDKLR